MFSLGAGPWDPSHRFETSWLLSPWQLFAYRALVAVYTLTTNLFVIGWNCGRLGDCAPVGRSLSYFTVLAYWGQAGYFGAAAVHTLAYAAGRPSLLARLPGPLRAAHALCYSSVVVFAPLVALVFWPLLYRGPWFAEPFDAWRNVSQHALNALFALAELLLPRTEPMPWPHLPCLLLVLLAYLALAYLTAAVQGFYPYRFLDRDAVGGRAAVAAYLLGIAAALVLVFCLARALLALRRWLTETRLGCRGRFPPAADLADDAEMHAVAPSKSPSSTGAGPTTTTSILPL